MEKCLSLREKVKASYMNNKKVEFERQAGDPLIFYGIRPLSLEVTPFFLRLKWTPNQVSCLGAAFGISACFAFLFGSPVLFQAGAWLYLLYFLCDYVDGNIARFHGTTNHYGKFLDCSFDILIESLLWPSLGWGIYRYLQRHPFASWEAFSQNRELFALLGGVTAVWIIATEVVKLRYSAILANIGQNVPREENPKGSPGSSGGSSRALGKRVRQGRCFML